MSEQQSGGRNSIWADLTRVFRRDPGGPRPQQEEKADRAAMDVELRNGTERKRDPSFNAGDMPEAVQRRYYTQPSRWTGDPAYFSTPTADKPAFQDRGNRLVTDNDSREVAKDLVTVAEHRGWDRVQVAGSEAFRRAVWFEAAERGIAVRGYKPTDRDLQELDRIRNDKARNSIAPVPDRQQAREAAAEPMQSADAAQGREARPRDRARRQDVPDSSPTRSLPTPVDGYRRPTAEALDRAISVTMLRAGLDPAEARAANRAYASADWAWTYADDSNSRTRGAQSVDRAMTAMDSFAGKSRAHAEIASAIADNHYYDMALVGRWYVERGDRDPGLVRDLTDQKRLHAPDSDRKPGTPPWNGEERERANGVADRTRRNERAAQSQLRAMDIVVRRALEASPETADRVMRIAREQIADQLGEGRDIKPARVRGGPEREAEQPAARRTAASRQRSPTPTPQRDHRPPERQRNR